MGASVVGCRLGPGALRLAGIQEALERFGAKVDDLGDVSGPVNPMAPPVDGYRHLSEVIAWNHALHDAVYAEVSAGRMPIMLGGDHCLAIGSVSAVARHCREQGRPLRLLWFDAHADYNTASITPSGNMHGMPVAVLHRVGAGAPWSSCRARCPHWIPVTVREIGLRDVDAGGEAPAARAADRGLRHALPRRGGRAGGDGGWPSTTSIPRPTCTSASISTSSTTSIAPGVGTPVRGGPDLPRSPSVHGDDRRHRTARQRSTSSSSTPPSTSRAKPHGSRSTSSRACSARAPCCACTAIADRHLTGSRHGFRWSSRREGRAACRDLLNQRGRAGVASAGTPAGRARRRRAAGWRIRSAGRRTRGSRRPSRRGC